MIGNGELKGDFSNLLFFVPSMADRPKEVN